MTPKIADLEALARGAGEILRAGYIQRPGFERAHEVAYKGAVDLVTEIDARSEAYLLGEVQRSFPGHHIFAEESGGIAGQDCCVWYIDPLDGTVNYAHGIPIFSVSIAYQEDGLMRLGVVYDPMRDELFSAERGVGAWLNGQPIRPASPPDLSRSLLVTGFPYDIRTNPNTNLDHYARFALESQAVRRLGSAALDLCYVASGRFDGYWELVLMPWDMAAGTLIASESGAVVTSTSGDRDYFHPPYPICAAATPQVHAEMLAVLARK